LTTPELYLNSDLFNYYFRGRNPTEKRAVLLVLDDGLPLNVAAGKTGIPQALIRLHILSLKHKKIIVVE